MRELRGAEAANAICTDAMRQTAELIERGIAPCLGVVRIGDDAADAAYERGIRKRFDAGGRKCGKHLPERGLHAGRSRRSHSEACRGRFRARHIAIYAPA